MTISSRSCKHWVWAVVSVAFLNVSLYHVVAKSGDGFIYSVLKRNNVVFAATELGLYKASLSEHVWHKLATPPSMPTSGMFATEGAASPILVYYTSNDPELSFPGDKSPVMYVSDDFGQTWIQKLSKNNFSSVFVHSNGRLYADAFAEGTSSPRGQDAQSLAYTTDNKGTKHYQWHRLLVSDDQGTSWRDISAGLALDLTYFIFTDPDHPNLVCVSGTETGRLSKGIVFQADDEHYRWKSTPEDEWHGGMLSRENVFGSLQPGSNAWDDRATLKTFFKRPFLKWGNGIDIQLVQIETEKPAYTFRQNEPMPVALTAKYTFPEPALHFNDNRDERVFWVLRVLPEKGKGTFTECEVTKLYTDSPDHAAMVKRCTNDPNLMIIKIDTDHSYHRTIDLAKLYHFPAPGKYQVQPMKALGSFIADDAGFTGQIIDVTVTK